jgi:hypothetical protein
MKPVKLMLLAVLACAALAAVPRATATDSAEQFMQGTWRLTGMNDATHRWFLEWTFDHGKFNLDGYPPLHQEGKYRVLKEQGNKLTLELYEQQGNFGTDNEKLEVVVDKDKDTLKIRDQGPFKRSTKS